MNALLRYFTVLLKASAEDQSYVAGCIKTAILQAEEKWGAGPGIGFGCIEKGLIMNLGKRRTAILFYRECEVFPLGAERISYHFEAVEPTVIHYINEEDVNAICERLPRFNRLLMGVLQKNTIQLDSCTRIALEPDPLLRFQRYSRRYPMFTARIPPKTLGRFLDMSETMVKAMREKRGLKHI